jgi:ubiquinone biosynthesis UbiH/UbiF/VisC/COQ6 family hydroxylase
MTNAIDRIADPMNRNSDSARVIIVGAGPAGLALAIALAQAGIASTVLEQAPLASLEAPPEDGRDIALTHRSRRILTTLGLWTRLPECEIAPLRRAEVRNGASPWTLPFDAKATGHDALGWLVPNHRIREACHAVARESPLIHIACEARVVDLRRGPCEAVVETVSPGIGTEHRAALVVAADSRYSTTRRLAGIGAQMLDFGRTAIVCRVAHAQPHSGIAHEGFRYGHTLAMLPMGGQQSSAVLTVRSDHAPAWLALDDVAFAERIAEQFDHRLGAMRCAGTRHAYPLVATYAHRFADERFALVGDASVGMHPVTAHGYNFGLYGIEGLADALRSAHRQGRDLGDAGVLRIWATGHRRATRPIYLGTNALVQLFTDERGPARLLRSAVLRVASGLPPLKAAVSRQLTGQAAG